MQLAEVDALSPENVENPYALYQLLRDESPVHWDANLEVLLVSRYEDVVDVLRDPEDFLVGGRRNDDGASGGRPSRSSRTGTRP